MTKGIFRRYIIPLLIHGVCAGHGVMDYGSRLDRDMEAARAKAGAGGRLSNKEKKLLKYEGD